MTTAKIQAQNPPTPQTLPQTSPRLGLKRRGLLRGLGLQLTFALALGAVLSALPASAKVLWRGDFETGDLSQWSKTQMVSPDRLQVVNNPVLQGRYALKTTVRPGDDPIGASGNRNELVITGIDKSGSERVYRWHTLFPADFESADTWQLFTQWHHDGSDGSPPVEFFVWGESIILRVDGEDLWSAPLERGRWQEFVFRVKWARNGWVELHHNGDLALERTSASTLYQGQGVYLKQGLYRDAEVAHTQVVYHDTMTVAEELEDLEADAGSDAFPAEGELGAGSKDSAALSVQEIPVVVDQGQERRALLPEGSELSEEDLALLLAEGCSAAGGAGLPALLTGAVLLFRRRLGRRRG